MNSPCLFSQPVYQYLVQLFSGTSVYVLTLPILSACVSIWCSYSLVSQSMNSPCLFSQPVYPYLVQLFSGTSVYVLTLPILSACVYVFGVVIPWYLSLRTHLAYSLNLCVSILCSYSLAPQSMYSPCLFSQPVYPYLVQLFSGTSVYELTLPILSACVSVFGAVILWHLSLRTHLAYSLSLCVRIWCSYSLVPQSTYSPCLFSQPVCKYLVQLFSGTSVYVLTLSILSACV